MPRPKYNPHPDANQPEIVQKLKDAGFWVINVSRWISEFDLLVFRYDVGRDEDRWSTWELKTEEGELTEKQKQAMEEHPGAILEGRDAEDILAEYGLIEILKVER